MLKDLGVDISKNTKIERAALEVRVDASTGRGIAVGGRIRHFATPTLWAQELTQDGIVKITKIPGISNPADPGTKHFDGGSSRRALEKLKAGLESRCEQKCKKSRDPILKFSLLTMHAKLQKRKWSMNSTDHETSDAVKLKQLREQMV